MTTATTIIAHGGLGVNSDTYFLVSGSDFIPLDVRSVIDEALVNKPVSVIGRMEIQDPVARPGFTKLVVDRIIPHVAIASRAYEIYKSGRGGSADENWLRAERDLLNLSIANQQMTTL